MKAHGGCYDGIIRCAGCSNISSLFDALKISILHFLECTVTFPRFWFVEDLFGTNVVTPKLLLYL